MEIQELNESVELAAPTIITVAIAVNGSKNSKSAVQWALDKFIPEGRIFFKLLHVQSKLKMIPTPMGNYIPISNVREDVASAYRKEMEWQANNLLDPYKKMCARKQVEAEAVILESDDVPDAINGEITKFKTCKLVLGASSRNIFTRKISARKMSSRISGSVPRFCTVYVVSRGKLSSVQPATSAVDGENDLINVPERVPSISSSNSTTFSADWSETEGTLNVSHRHPSLSSQRNQALANINNRVSSSRLSPCESLISSRHGSLRSENISFNFSDEASASNSDDKTNFTESQNQVDLNLELGRIRVKLRHFQLQESGVNHLQEEIMLKEIKIQEEKSRKLEIKEIGNRYTWEEIQAATSAFSVEFKIGMGSNGTVYKAKFNHTVAAVKVLHSLEGYGTKQFEQEIEILSKIHHPHLLLLLGACPEKGCLIYEYMENGSLEDRLNCKNNTAPLNWYDRYRIGSEIASALVFLHSSKPKPVIHRDLKPANILLDKNLVSKIGDVGLSILLNPTVNQINQANSTIVKNTAPVGTLCYIDPEYQRTGTVSAKSDVYAFGMVILQLLTGQTPMGLAHTVERAIEEGKLSDILDKRAGDWPADETKELAELGLSCVELRRRDRPSLSEKVLPVLERLNEFASKAKDLAGHMPSSMPSHFICPILQEVMDDPYVASDGYTYDRKAIEIWLSINDKSPMTNLKLPNKNLIPNHSLRSAIMDWKSKSP